MKLALLFVWLFLSVASPAYPHGGGLDAYGCHYNRKVGGYHCHRGPFSGQSFESKEEMMLRQLGAQKPATTSNAKEKR
jgi:hypothetical protein